ncbi:hypothetical protein [Thalassoroseus pseudoceratinae]|uniref:hypothetical protein n=1 Tax=Thalassoroseus pseudoceratinae TaxID=2713176 RepID=UPI001421629D|nr:hypothetical protein [Thalassoroseus pseudoceratinae]
MNQNIVRMVCGVGLLGFGYLLGASGSFSTPMANAQQAANDSKIPLGLQRDTIDKVKQALDNLSGAQQALKDEGRYNPAINGINAFATTVGGVDAVGDLESNRAVDPETFAALYAGQATNEVKQHLGKDQEGRLTYKDKVIRMYSLAQLQQLYQQRQMITEAVTK